MSAKDLWGDIPAADDLQTPKRLLREQAQLLADKTRHTLTANVETTSVGNEIVSELVINAPFLNYYKVAIVRIRHQQWIYPLTFYDLIRSPNNPMLCENAQQFEAVLADTLSSIEVRRVIASLLAQSQD